jgi:hypothetical protein
MLPFLCFNTGRSRAVLTVRALRRYPAREDGVAGRAYGSQEMIEASSPCGSLIVARCSRPRRARAVRLRIPNVRYKSGSGTPAARFSPLESWI